MSVQGCVSCVGNNLGPCVHRVWLQVWMSAGCLPLTAKVADFGLALPLGPSDTHATLLARVRGSGWGIVYASLWPKSCCWIPRQADGTLSESASASIDSA
jgi:hypothetical protein